MQKETRIYLIRHGAVENPDDIVYSRLPIPLSEEGKRHMVDLCTILKSQGVKFDAVYSSPVERARQSVQILQEQLEVEKLELTDDLSDVDVGRLEGAPMQIVRDAEYSEESLREMGYEIETKKAIMKRISRIIAEVAARHQGETVAMVSHGDVTRLGLWSCEFPEKAPPRDLRDDDYLAVAEAVVLRFEGQRYLGREFIRREQSTTVETDNIRRTEAY